MRKIHVVGGASGYASWMEGTELVSRIEEADLVVLTGGSDVDPALYGDNTHRSTYTNIERDKREIISIEAAVKMGKPIFGTCRGLQLLNVIAGGKMIQDMRHPHAHVIRFFDGTDAVTNSLHHQMVHPFNLREEQYRIVAYAKGLSGYHLDGSDVEMELPVVHGILVEPEAVLYPEINAFGQQSHLEMLSQDAPVVGITRRLLDLHIKGELYDFVTKSSPIKSLLNVEG